MRRARAPGNRLSHAPRVRRCASRSSIERFSQVVDRRWCTLHRQMHRLRARVCRADAALRSWPAVAGCVIFHRRQLLLREPRAFHLSPSSSGPYRRLSSPGPPFIIHSSFLACGRRAPRLTHSRSRSPSVYRPRTRHWTPVARS